MGFLGRVGVSSSAPLQPAQRDGGGRDSKHGPAGGTNPIRNGRGVGTR